jgi:hypothetical protein
VVTVLFEKPKNEIIRISPSARGGQGGVSGNEIFSNSDLGFKAIILYKLFRIFLPLGPLKRAGYSFYCRLIVLLLSGLDDV